MKNIFLLLLLLLFNNFYAQKSAPDSLKRRGIIHIKTHGLFVPSSEYDTISKNYVSQEEIDAIKKVLKHYPIKHIIDTISNPRREIDDLKKKFKYLPTRLKMYNHSDTIKESDFSKLDIDTNFLVVLSLVDIDSSITKNWEYYKEQNKYKNCLLVVSTKDSPSKVNFTSYFHEKRAEGFNIITSYMLTVNEFHDKCPDLLYHLNYKK